MTGSLVAIILTAVLAAVLLDLWVLRGMRQKLQSRGLGRKAGPPGVYIFGAYSPVLTWLRYHSLYPEEALTDPTPGDPSSEPDPTQDQNINEAYVPRASSWLSTILTNSKIRTADAISSLTWRSAVLEIGFITVAVLFFCSALLDFDPPTELPGNESGVFQTLDWVLYNSLHGDHKFPLWNPYLRTGLPYIADPMLHAYSPVISLPVLIFGVRSGFKLAVVISFLLAALGMWWLGVTLGMRSPARVWMALMFAFAGQPVARFFQGQYLFIFGFAWIPWAVANLFRAVLTQRKRYIALAAFAMALSFFSGNAYYPFYLLITAAILGLVMLPGFQRNRPFIKIDFKLLTTLGLTGILALGLVAIQLIPLVEFWPRLDKSLEIAGAHTLQQIFLDYTSKDPYRPDAFSTLPAREEFYAYIGYTPFIALILLPFAFWKRNRRPLLVFVILALFVIMWVDMDLMPWYGNFIQVKLLLQFRHLLRILIFGSFALVVLAALGLDSAWGSLARFLDSEFKTVRDQLISFAAFAGLVILAGLMAWGVMDLYQTNRVYVTTQPSNEKVGAAARWLRQYDLTDTYMRANPNNMAQKDILSARLRFIEVWYHFGETIRLENSISKRPIVPGPHYVLQSASEAPPQYADVSKVAEVEGYNIFRIPGSLPYAFTVKDLALRSGDPNQRLTREEVNAFTSFSSGPNRVEVIASGAGDETLVVLSMHYPGWQVYADGHHARLENAHGFLAVHTLPGTHKYEFIYRPWSFYSGLLISLLFTGIALYLLVSDTRSEVRQAFASLRSLPGKWRASRQSISKKLYSGRWVLETAYQPPGLPAPPGMELPENSRMRLTVEALPDQMNAPGVALRRWLWATNDLLQTWIHTITLPMALFAGALLVYAITRFWALERFPIYFFGDEAVQTLFGEDLITRGFHGLDGTLFPMYVEAAGQRWTPLISMYFQALTMTLFGKSIFVARGTSAAVSLLGAAAVGLSLKHVFKARYWWAGVLLVAVTPGWFLHSRTAFETVMTAAFYGCFLLFYLLYRSKSPHYLYAAILFGAATFYSYSNAQAIILAAAGLLFLSDLRYHFRHPGLLMRGLALVGVLAIPFILFRINQPSAIGEHLRMVGSYWFAAAPLQEKVLTFLQKFSYGLSPQYWFFSNTQDLDRHRMLGMGHILTVMLPFFLIGLAICLWRVRSPVYRAVILAGLATPVGAALVDIGIARVLAFIIPANILIGLGLEWLLQQLKDRLSYKLTALLLFAVLAWANFSLLRTALVDGPLWFHDYGLYGMQYGARQLFEEAIPTYLQKNPNATIMVTSTWANGPDNFIRFFVPLEQRNQVRMNGIASYQFKRLPLTDDDVFVMTPAEVQVALNDPKFTNVRQDVTIPYPDGTPGFYFVRLSYSDRADALFTADKEARKRLLESQVLIDGQNATIRYSPTDMGTPDLIFDGDLFTLIRGLEANPYVIEITFPQPRSISALSADFGMVNIQLTVQLFEGTESQPVEFKQTYRKDGAESGFHMPLEHGAEQITHLRVEILNIDTGETANIHIRELHFLP